MQYYYTKPVSESIDRDDDYILFEDVNTFCPSLNIFVVLINFVLHSRNELFALDFTHYVVRSVSVNQLFDEVRVEKIGSFFENGRKECEIEDFDVVSNNNVVEVSVWPQLFEIVTPNLECLRLHSAAQSELIFTHLQTITIGVTAFCLLPSRYQCSLLFFSKSFEEFVLPSLSELSQSQIHESLFDRLIEREIVDFVKDRYFTILPCYAVRLREHYLLHCKFFLSNHLIFSDDALKGRIQRVRCTFVASFEFVNVFFAWIHGERGQY